MNTSNNTRSHSEAKLIMEMFYAAFAKRDFQTMQSLYAEEAIFSDPVFKDLNAIEVRAMWQMLIERGKDLKVTHTNVEVLDDGHATCTWRAAYSFGIKKRTVVNEIKGTMEIQNGRIIAHTDVFSLHKWASQALGISGVLLGWAPFFQKAIQSKARSGLDAYMKRNL
jgi:ketosteroid isomerase-like protein